MPAGPATGGQRNAATLTETVCRRILYTTLLAKHPILIEGSPEEAKVKAAGWEIAFDGMEVAP